MSRADFFAESFTGTIGHPLHATEAGEIELLQVFGDDGLRKGVDAL